MEKIVLFFQTSSGGNLDKVHFTSTSSAVSKLYIDGVDESSAIDTSWSSGWSSTTYADNTWHHFYLEFASSQTSPITFGQPERADGFYADPSEYVKWGGGGKFDNVRIFSGALTTTQINILLEKNNKTHVADISNVNVTTTTTRDVAFTFNKNNDGRIGVHTLNPTTTLDVGGDINFSGSLYQNGSVVNIGGSTFNQNTNLTINSLTTINDISFSGNLYQNGALFTGIDITSDVSLNNMDISGVLATNKSNNQISLGAHIIPTTNAAFDLGNAEYKIRHLFLSDNSLWIGDDHKIDISGGKMKFKKRKKTVVPTSIENNGGTANSALSFAGVGQLSNMKLHHWVSYAKTLSGLETASVKDIFQTEISADWEEDLEMNSGGGIDATSDVSLNNLDIHGKLDISGYLQSTDSAVSTPYTSLNVTNSLFISITTALSSGNTTGITMNTLVYDNDTWIAYVHNSNYTKMIRIKAIYQNNTVYIGITESKFFSGSQTSDYIKTNWGSATTGAIYPTNSNGYGANVVISIFGAQQTAIDLNDVSTIQNTPNSSWDVFTNITSSQIYTENNSVDFTADVHIETFTYGTSNQSSDDRIKHNEEPITNALSILAKITPKHYFKTGSTLYDASHNFALNDQNHPLSESGSPLLFKKDYTIETGIIAQEIQSIPELRFAVQNTTPLGVDYNSIHCTHIAATKELHQMVKSQQTHIEEQQQEIEHLKMVNQDINSQLNTAISELQTIKHYLGI